ncbi:MAG: hypothetical protein KIT11_06890 [Fimbriimonadaceae bacterium]|nr:hypothetical protein [Fimbriimonadaceae bacterium]QYK56078.1 MAG: hypothetical protein KF733_01080 [Fimbriimonadaceae bacterium]
MLCTLLSLLALGQDQPVVVAVDQLAVVRRDGEGWERVEPEWAEKHKELSFARVTVGGTGATSVIALWSGGEGEGGEGNEGLVFCGEGPREETAEVYVSGGKVGVPRPVVSGTGNRDGATADVVRYLAAKGLKPAKVASRKGWQADLDGDGFMDKVVVLSTQKKGEDRPPTDDDFTIALLVWGKSNKIETLALENKFEERRGMPVLDIPAIADFDGDGVMELAVSIRDRQMNRATVWGWVDGKPEQLGEAGVGE